MHKASRVLSDPKCMTCGSVVHGSADCPWKGKEHLRCHQCRQYGHWMKQCKRPMCCFQCMDTLRDARNS
ncbi:hypothetical protein BJX68DRAFT_244792 [Aspergillus pseudodeflectus]|uniref:CCHC-type domain-containing protein n=1 Tax=Aspergillus pseudodeflectus TaxID=176178 RepID=A0ABR4JSB3_9EURO